MPSRKSYFNRDCDLAELVINLNKDGGLYVEVSEDMGFPMQNINLPYEDAKEIIEELYDNLKQYERDQSRQKLIDLIDS